MSSSQKSRSILAALLVLALTFVATLSAAPQLHNWLHKVGDRSTHECAATLMSSGNVEHSACEPVSVKPQPAPSGPVYRAQRFPRVLAFFGFARLEHAPPAWP